MEDVFRNLAGNGDDCGIVALLPCFLEAGVDGFEAEHLQSLLDRSSIFFELLDPRFGVMQDVPHNGLVRHLGVVRVSVVDWIVLALTHICGERLAAIRLVRIVWFAVMFEEICNERVRAGSIVRWVRQRQDIII